MYFEVDIVDLDSGNALTSTTNMSDDNTAKGFVFGAKVKLTGRISVEFPTSPREQKRHDIKIGTFLFIEGENNGWLLCTVQAKIKHNGVKNIHSAKARINPDNLQLVLPEDPEQGDDVVESDPDEEFEKILPGHLKAFKYLAHDPLETVMVVKNWEKLVKAKTNETEVHYMKSEVGFVAKQVIFLGGTYRVFK